MDNEENFKYLSLKSIKRAELVEVGRVYLTNDTAENWDILQGFKARPEDILICTYPKSGTTWIQEIVDMVQQGGDLQKCARGPIYERIPFLDLFPPEPIIAGLAEAETMPSPRIMKTHLQTQLMPPSFWEQNCKSSSIYYCPGKLLDSVWALTTVLGGVGYSVSSGQQAKRALSMLAGEHGQLHCHSCLLFKNHKPFLVHVEVLISIPIARTSTLWKIIYVARNAKDNAASYFHFHRMNQWMPEPGTWDQFLENFLIGKVAWGSWLDHVCGWWEVKDQHPVLYLLYEDMKEDPAREIRKVAQFLGLDLPESVLKKIVQHTAFEIMKANPMANYSTLPSFIMDQAVSPFMRAGTVGNWKKQFTVAQSEQLDDMYAPKLQKSGLTFRYQLEA